MVLLLALLGALVLGVVLGLLYRGFIMIGDQRTLDVMTQQLITESRMSAATRQAISEMRQAASDRFRSDT